MFRAREIIVLCAILSSAATAAGEVRDDGSVLSAEQWRPAAASFDEFVRQRVSAPKLDPRDPDIKATWFSEEARKQFESLRVQEDIVAERITYASEGLAIDGYRIAPREPVGRCPVVVWGRGGNRGDGVISEWDLIDLAGWARRGWVVIASNYRGAPRSEGRDEFGGADVADQLNAIAVARTIPCADMRNVFMFGRSRGGLMTYRAIAAGAPVRAAATIGGAADLSEAARDRPDLAPAMRQIMPITKMRRPTASAGARRCAGPRRSRFRCC